ncbi:MAG: HD domain-containing protein [Sphingomonadaceae bacterium]
MNHNTDFTYATLCERFPTLPATPVINQAFAYARERMPPYLFNHVVRCWIFAVQLGELKHLTYDAEVVAVATLLHDLGLTHHADGPHRFEVNGAAVAMAFVEQHGFDARRRQLVWDSIALHATPSIGFLKEPEVALCGRAISVDFGAPDYAAFEQDAIDAIVAAVPRLNLKSKFAACLCQIARDKPETTYDNLIRDFGERYVSSYQRLSWVDIIAGGPFQE